MLVVQRVEPYCSSDIEVWVVMTSDVSSTSNIVESLEEELELKVGRHAFDDDLWTYAPVDILDGDLWAQVLGYLAEL